LTKVTINNIDVTGSLISWAIDVSENNDKIKNMDVVLSRSVESLFNIYDNSLTFLPIKIERGVASATESIVFNGYIKTFSLNYGKLNLLCADKLYEATKRTVTYSYDKDFDPSAGNVSEIFKDLINYYTTLTADATSVTDSGSTYIISKLICKADTVYDKCKFLAETLGWMFYYDSDDDLVHFHPIGYNVNSTTIVDNENIAVTPIWHTDETNIYNTILVEGAIQEVQTFESGRIGTTSGYTTSSIQLNYEPITVRVLCDASNPPTTERVIGVQDSTLTYSAYIDKSKMQVIWNTGTYTPGAADYVIVQYTYMRPTPVLVSDDASIAAYGIKEAKLTKNEIKNVADAEVYANQYLLDHKNPIQTCNLKVVNVSDLNINQGINIIDRPNNQSGLYKITRVKKCFPYNFDEISVTTDILQESDYLYNIVKRIRELENEGKDDFNTLIQIKQYSDSVIYENRYIKGTHTYITGDTLIFDHPTMGVLDTGTFYDPSISPFILGHTTYGVLGTSTLGAGSMYTDVEFLDCENNYVELFYDDEFKDASTTADWDTTNQQLEIESGEIAVSESFVIDVLGGANCFKTVQFLVEGTDIGGLVYQIGEYDNISITYTTIPTTGTTTNQTSAIVNLTGTNNYGLNWKITNSGATGTITKLTIRYTK
jgi:hypothetical protein